MVLFIFQACRANTICGSFDSCVCDTNCYETAKKNRQEKEKQVENYKWLHTAATTNGSPNNNDIPPPLFSGILSDCDNSKWLVAPPKVSSAPTISSTASSVFSSPLLISNDKKQWLLRSCSLKSTPLKMDRTLPNHFADNDNSKWLRPASPPPTKRINLAPVFSERFWEDDKSKWLHPQSLRCPAAASSLKAPFSPYAINSSTAHCGTGSSFVDTSSALKNHPDNNTIWLAPNTITEALDEIKMKSYFACMQKKY